MSEFQAMLVERLAELNNIKNPKDGTIVKCNEDKNTYMYNHGWQKLVGEETPSGFRMNLYDYNKMLIANFSPLTQEQIDASIDKINEWAFGNYQMLYGKSMSYFTVFHRNLSSKESLGFAVFDCLKEVGQVVSIDINSQDNVWEIWIRTPEQENECLYLFNYDEGVVEYDS